MIDNGLYSKGLFCINPRVFSSDQSYCISWNVTVHISIIGRCSCFWWQMVLNLLLTIEKRTISSINWVTLMKDDFIWFSCQILWSLYISVCEFLKSSSTLILHSTGKLNEHKPDQVKEIVNSQKEKLKHLLLEIKKWWGVFEESKFLRASWMTIRNHFAKVARNFCLRTKLWH